VTVAKAIKMDQVHELLYQTLETQKGGIAVYETALKCVRHDRLREEWQEHLEQARKEML
jgi:hypothetical protein